MIEFTLAKLNKCLLVVITLVFLGSMNCVLYGQIQNDSPKVKQQQTNDGSQTFIKESGWSIPNSELKKTESDTFKVKVNENRKVKLKVTYYDFLNSILTNEPFVSIEKEDRQYRYQRISEYKVKNRIFCYKILYSYFGEGSVYFFAYYDEDGDGKFESLVFHETVDGRSLFGNPPHIPEWVLK